MASGIKVLHINTSDQGGAATAALRLHVGLLQQGVDSSFLSLNQENARKYPGTQKFSPPKRAKSILDRVSDKLGKRQTARERNTKLLNGLSGSYETFSFPETDYRPEDDSRIREADIIHLHWISYFINYATFFRSIQKPIVWTMHDMNPVMGGFHYQGDRDRNPAFNSLELKLAAEKSSVFSAVKNLTVVTPSTWLGECVHAHEVLGKLPYRHIPYGLDTSVFKPHDQVFARNVFNLPADKKIILFVTERIGNFRKGFDLLMEAIGQVDLGNNYIIVTIGDTSPEVSAFPNTLSLGRINDDHLLSILYSAADLFVLPSREDNFPNVMLESLACGTPVMGFAIGGLRDVIRQGENGILAESVSVDSLRKAFNAYTAGVYPFNRNTIRTRAVSEFSLDVQAERYKSLYLQLLKTPD